MTEQEIRESLVNNTNWPGSPEKMWRNITQELRPKTAWWKKTQIWLAPVAAAIIFLVILFNNSLPDHSGQHVLPEAAPENMIMLRTLSVVEQFAEVIITPKQNTLSEAYLDLEIELTALKELKISDQPLNLRLIKVDDQLSIAEEFKFNPWNNQVFKPEQTLKTTIQLQTPAEPGEYLIEVEIPAFHMEEEVWINQQQTLEVN